MGQDRLTKAVLRRLKELGLPACLMDIEEFRENFLVRRWVMFVRDGDPIAHVHLFQPQSHSPLQSRKHPATRHSHPSR